VLSFLYGGGRRQKFAAGASPRPTGDGFVPAIIQGGPQAGSKFLPSFFQKAGEIFFLENCKNLLHFWGKTCIIEE